MTTYSSDLRQRVITAYEQSGNKSAVCRTFSIARTTLDYWLKLREETGGLEPRPHKIRGHSHKVKDLDSFKLWLEQQQFERIRDLMPLFEAEYGVPISHTNMHKWVRRAGWTNKKMGELSGSKPGESYCLSMAIEPPETAV